MVNQSYILTGLLLCIFFLVSCISSEERQLERMEEALKEQKAKEALESIRAFEAIGNRMKEAEKEAQTARKEHMNDPLRWINARCISKSDEASLEYKGNIIFISAISIDGEHLTTPRGHITIKIREAVGDKFLGYERGRLVKEISGDIDEVGEFIDDPEIAGLFSDVTGIPDLGYKIDIPIETIDKSKFSDLTELDDDRLGVVFEYGTSYVDITLTDDKEYKAVLSPYADTFGNSDTCEFRFY